MNDTQKPIYLRTKTNSPTMTLVAFDLDDTLYKESDYVKSALLHIAGFLSSKYHLSAERIFDLMSRDGVNPFDALYSFLNTENIVIEENTCDLLKLYRNHFPDLLLPVESRIALERLIASGYRLAIITDGRSVGQMYKILSLGLDRFVSRPNVSISEEIGCDKHSAFPFERMMKRNPDCDSFIYVGDNPEKDFIWPNRLGWTSVMLLDADSVNIHSQQPDRLDEKSRAQYEIRSLAELPTLLQKLRL